MFFNHNGSMQASIERMKQHLRIIDKDMTHDFPLLMLVDGEEKYSYFLCTCLPHLHHYTNEYLLLKPLGYDQK
jgi:hypothetical protein